MADPKPLWVRFPVSEEEVRQLREAAEGAGPKESPLTGAAVLAACRSIAEGFHFEDVRDAVQAGCYTVSAVQGEAQRVRDRRNRRENESGGR
jgi:hypothetical protein